jgi:uncharacterized membrane protein
MLKSASKWLMAAFYVLAGVMHFVSPGFYVQIVPRWLPWHLELVYLSGVAEIVLGVLLLVPATSRVAAWGIIALLIAVFPANLNMALNDVQLDPPPPFGQPSPLANWLRLPMQLVLIAWAWWYTRDGATAPGARTPRAVA